MKGLIVKALVADCVLVGKPREIRFASAEGRGDLIIKGLTYDEAMMVLRAATTIAGDAQEVPSKVAAVPPQLVTPPEAKQHPERSTVALVESAPSEEPELETSQKPESQPAPVEVQDPAASGGGAVSEPASEPEPKPAPTNGQGNGKQDALIAALQGHKRILHIVNVLVENGFKTSDEVLAKCQEVRAHVPALERITPSDFDERIRRVYEVLDAGAVG